MKNDLNMVIMEGRLTKMPVLRETPNHVPVCDVIVASNRTRLKKDGTREKYTTYVKVTQWSQDAQWAHENLAAGDYVLIRGELVDDNFMLDDGKTSGRLKIDDANIRVIQKAQVKNSTLD